MSDKRPISELVKFEKPWTRLRIVRKERGSYDIRIDGEIASVADALNLIAAQPGGGLYLKPPTPPTGD